LEGVSVRVGGRRGDGGEEIGKKQDWVETDAIGRK